MLPRRCYQRANEVFEAVVNVQLQIVDENGLVVYGLREHELERAEESAFWFLFDSVIREWNLSQFLEQQLTRTAVVPAGGVLQGSARAVAGRIIASLNAERVAA